MGSKGIDDGGKKVFSGRDRERVFKTTTFLGGTREEGFTMGSLEGRNRAGYEG